MVYRYRPDFAIQKLWSYHSLAGSKQKLNWISVLLRNIVDRPLFRIGPYLLAKAFARLRDGSGRMGLLCSTPLDINHNAPDWFKTSWAAVEDYKQATTVIGWLRKVLTLLYCHIEDDTFFPFCGHMSRICPAEPRHCYPIGYSSVDHPRTQSISGLAPSDRSLFIYYYSQLYLYITIYYKVILYLVILLEIEIKKLIVVIKFIFIIKYIIKLTL